MRKILSIVIPVYNVEKYLEKCVLSCLFQDIAHESYEIIIVNDGSPDNCHTIAKRIEREFNNVLVIDQTNQGLSMARNVGLLYAQGDYVWFVDSDDYIEKDCLGRIVSKLETQPDIVQIQARYVYENDVLGDDLPFFIIKQECSGKELFLRYGNLPAPAQFSIFRREFLLQNKLLFMKGILHEDSEFKPRATYLADKIISENTVCYNYLQRTTGSITAVFKLRNGMDLIVVMNKLLKFTEEQNMPLIYSRNFYRLVGLNMNTLLSGTQKLSNSDRIAIIAELYKNRHLFKYMIKSRKLKYIMEGLMFMININFGLILYKNIK